MVKCGYKAIRAVEIIRTMRKPTCLERGIVVSWTSVLVVRIWGEGVWISPGIAIHTRTVHVRKRRRKKKNEFKTDRLTIKNSYYRVRVEPSSSLRARSVYCTADAMSTGRVRGGGSSGGDGGDCSRSRVTGIRTHSVVIGGGVGDGNRNDLQR